MSVRALSSHLVATCILYLHNHFTLLVLRISSTNATYLLSFYYFHFGKRGVIPISTDRLLTALGAGIPAAYPFFDSTTSQLGS